MSLWLYFLTLVNFVLLDYLYLGLFGGNQKYLKIHKRIQGKTVEPRWYSIITAYLVLALGVYYFAVRPFENAVLSGNANHAILITGAMFGFASYGIYNFTNHSLFENYPLSIAIQDTLWGTIASALVAFLTLHQNDYLDSVFILSLFS